MKIAVCLYGQPREYIRGFNNINNFIINNSLEVDYYYHTWILNDNETSYNASSWRYINQDQLQMEPNIINNLNSLYKPKKFLFEKSKTFDPNVFENTISYKNMNLSREKLLEDKILYNNLNNVLSQLYSRNKVRDLLYSEINENNTLYDIVLTLRFDYLNEININVSDLDLTKIYTAGIYFPRHMISDNILLLPPNSYLNIFNIYDNLYSLLNNEDINKFMLNLNEHIVINVEAIIMGSIIYNNEYHNLITLNYLTNFY
uniref:Uncharacterized protein n=1 Tax=viral metagenome TaxID=1070528 RepID=A0A6C0H9R5_9ZZZZ